MRPGLNLKTFIADLDVPVLVGGCTNYQTALHLMRTGAAGVIVGYGAHLGSTTHAMLGIDVPMATALVDAAAARRDYLDETGGRYVHLVAYGEIDDRRRHREGARVRGRRRHARRGARRRCRRAGRRAVLGRDGRAPARAPLGRGRPDAGLRRASTLDELLVGPTADPSGERNLFGSVRRVMGKCGYSSLKEFQKAELIVTRGR